MNKLELIKAISDKSGFTQKDCTVVVDEFVATVIDALKAGDEIVITGFGKFAVKEKPARKGINPKTGETIEIAASKAPVFKVGKSFKDGIQ